VREKADEWRKKIPKKQEELTQTASKNRDYPLIVLSYLKKSLFQDEVKD